MFFLLLLFLYWYLIWGVFNLVLLPRCINHSSSSRYTRIYFSFAALLPLLYLLSSHSVLVIFVLFAFLITVLFPFPSSIIPNLLSNIIFQQVMFLCYLSYLQAISTSSLFLIYLFGIFISHVPLHFLPHVTTYGKIILFASLFLASSVIYYLYSYLPVTVAFFLATTIHSAFYAIIYRLDNNKQLGIIT